MCPDEEAGVYRRTVVGSSRRRFPRSRTSYVEREPVRGGLAGGVGRSAFGGQRPETLGASSSMPATVHKPNYCETCCSGSLLLMDIEVNSLSTE